MALDQPGKRYLSWAGSVLALGGVFFVGVRILASAETVDWRSWPDQAWGGLIVLALLYAAASFLVVVSWRCILAFLGIKAGWWPALRVHAASQVARYLPGNVFHLAGRQVLGAQENWPAIALAKSSIIELISLAAAGLLFSALVIPVIAPSVSLALASALFAVLVACIAWLGQLVFSPSIRSAFLFHCVFLLITGLVFVGVVFIVIANIDRSTFTVTSILSAYVVAWLAGLVTPGAPAGVGIREFALLALLGGQIPEGELLTAIVVGRVVTVAGDALFYLVSFIPNRTAA